MVYAAWGGAFTTPVGVKPLVRPPPVYTNETNTAQSQPVAPAAAYSQQGITGVVDYSGVYAPTTGWRPSKTVGPTPQQPAVPSPTYPQDPSQQVKKTSPWLWVGVGVTALFLFYVVKHHA